MSQEAEEAIVKKQEEKKKKLNEDSDSDEEEKKEVGVDVYMLNSQKNERTKSERAIRTLKKNRNGAGLANKIPTGQDLKSEWILVNPAVKCKLRYVQLQRVYDYLQIENEYIKNRQEAKKNEVKDDVAGIGVA